MILSVVCYYAVVVVYSRYFIGVKVCDFELQNVANSVSMVDCIILYDAMCKFFRVTFRYFSPFWLLTRYIYIYIVFYSFFIINTINNMS